MQPYVGQITLFAFSRVPTGWFLCDGSLKPISDYQVLFTLIGTTYGGNGTTNFAVPDLRGRVPLHYGQGPGLSMHVIGEIAGTENVTILAANMPPHSHTLTAVNNTPAQVPSVPGPGTTLLFGTGTYSAEPYGSVTTGAAADVMDNSSISYAPGSNLPHNNMMPTTICSYCIAWAGIFPQQG